MNLTRFDVYHRESLLTHYDQIAKADDGSQVIPIVIGWPDSYKLVATVQCQSKERAYQLTQHVENSSWLDNPDVRAGVEEARSTSVGDIIVNVDDIVPWMVSPFGYYLVLDVRGRLYASGVHDFDEVLFTASYEDVIFAIEEAMENRLEAEDTQYLDWEGVIQEATDDISIGTSLTGVQDLLFPFINDALKEGAKCLK